MPGLELSKLDLVRELRLRQWARQHFVPERQRRATWHPIVLNEMSRRDLELLAEQSETNGHEEAAEKLQGSVGISQGFSGENASARAKAHAPGTFGVHADDAPVRSPLFETV